MALDPLERLGLLDDLQDYQIALDGTTDPLDRMDILDGIASVIAQLGGEAEPQPEETPQPDAVPDIVTAFLNGDLSDATSDNFIKILEELEQYVGKFLTLAEVIGGAEQWWDVTGHKEQQA